MKRVVAVVVVLGMLAACSPGRENDEDAGIVVFAAASLTEAFGVIVGGFAASHPGVSVRFNFGPSDGLATQIGEGAPADVFASASPRWMDAVAADPGVSDRATFARNRLVVLMPASNPARIDGLEDLARPGIKLVLAAAGVPAGQYAREALRNAGVLDAALRNLVSNEEDVKGVVQKVLLDEADAGIAYQTDWTQAVRSKVRAIEIPDRWNVTAGYPIAVVASSSRREAARAFVEYVLGAGRPVLRRFGFLAPSP